MSLPLGRWTNFLASLGRLRRNRRQRQAAASRRRTLVRRHSMDHLEQRVVMNAAPIAEDDSLRIDPGQSVEISTALLLANDSDADGDALSPAAHSFKTTQGVVVNFDAQGRFTYQAPTGFVGTDSFKYWVDDGQEMSDAATVRIRVGNRAPTAADDALQLRTGTTLHFAPSALTGNDTDADGDAIEFAGLRTNTTHGSLTWNADGSFDYTPQAGFVGTDAFRYQITDGEALTVGNVTITVLPNRAPTAVGESYSLAEDGSLPISATGLLANDSDPDGHAIAFDSVVAGPTHGTLIDNGNGTLTYAPAANFNGADSFTYRIRDSLGATTEATVNLTISPVNDAPTAAGGTYTVNEDGTLTFTAGSDVDGDPLSVTIVASPGHGTLSVGTNASLSYTPAANYFGSDSFQFKVGDGVSTSPVATANITVAPRDDAPTASAPASAVVASANSFFFSGTNRITVGDIDSPSVSVTVAVDQGKLIKAGTSQQVTSLVVSGTVAAVNTALDNLQYLAPSNWAGQAQLTVTVTDDASVPGGPLSTTVNTAIRVQPRISINDPSAGEAAGSMVFTVSLSSATDVPVSVNWQALSSSAQSGVDFAAASGTLTFAAGQTSKTVSVPVVNDNVDEWNESIRVVLSAAAGGFIAKSDGYGVIVDDDADPTITIHDAVVDEAAGSAQVLVTLSGPSEKGVGVYWRPADGTAVRPDDWQSGTWIDGYYEQVWVDTSHYEDVWVPNMVNEPVWIDPQFDEFGNQIADGYYQDNWVDEGWFQPTWIDEGHYEDGAWVDGRWQDDGFLWFGSGQTQSYISIPIVDDLVGEDDETFTVELYSPYNGVLGNGTATVTIADDDRPVAVDDQMGDVASGASVSGNVLANDSDRQGELLAVDPFEGTVTGGYLSLAADGSYTLTAGGTEGPGEFAYTVRDTSGNASTASLRYNVVVPLEISVDDVAVNEADGTALITFRLNRADQAEVVAQFNTADNTAQAPYDYAALSGRVTFAAGETVQTVSVPITDDADHEADETFFVQVTSLNSVPLSDYQAVVTIVDNDQVLNLAPTAVDDDLGNVDQGATVTGNLLANDTDPENDTLSVDYFDGDVSGGHLTVQTNGDFTFTASETLGPGQYAYTAYDGHGNSDQGLLTWNVIERLTLSVGDVAVNEAAGTATITFHLNRGDHTGVSADFTTSDGSATAYYDYGPTNGQVWFNPGETDRTVTVGIYDDSTDESDETFFLDVTNVSGAALAASRATVTILDDDQPPPPPSVSFAGSGAVDEGSGPAATADLSAAGFASYFVDWGDGTTSSGTFVDSFSIDLSQHVYSDDGPSPGNGTPYDAAAVSVSVVDGYGGSASGSFGLSVHDVAPTIALDSSTISVDEGNTFTISGTVGDVGVDDVLTVSLVWRGETFTRENLHGGDAFSFDLDAGDDDASDAPSDDYQVTVTVADDDTLANSADATVTINNVAPTIHVDQQASGSYDESPSGSVTISGTVDDPMDDVTVTLKVNGQVWGSQTVAPGGSFSFDFTYDDDDTPAEGDEDDGPTGTFDFELAADDGDQGHDSASGGSITVNNVAPDITDEGYDLGEFTECDGFWWSEPAVAYTDPGSDAFHETWTYDDDPNSIGSHTITFTVSDDDGGSDSTEFTYTITECPPHYAILYWDEGAETGNHRTVVSAADDSYGDAYYGVDLQIDPRGVLENDSLTSEKEYQYTTRHYQVVETDDPNDPTELPEGHELGDEWTEDLQDPYSVWTADPGADPSYTLDETEHSDDIDSVSLNHDGSFTVTFRNEADIPEEFDGDTYFIYELDGSGEGQEEPSTARVTMDVGALVDADVDSDNNDEFADPDRTEEEDRIEAESGDPEKPGKVLSVNFDDLDGDGVPNFADGFDMFGQSASNAGSHFVPLVVSLGSALDWDASTISISYSGSDPAAVTRMYREDLGRYVYTPASGALRIWAVDGDDARRSSDIGAGGDYVTPDEETTLSSLPQSVKLSGDQLRFYVEAIAPSSSAGDYSVTVHVSGRLKEDSGGTAVDAEDVVHFTNRAMQFQSDSGTTIENIDPAAAEIFNQIASPSAAPTGGFPLLPEFQAGRYRYAVTFAQPVGNSVVDQMTLTVTDLYTQNVSFSGVLTETAANSGVFMDATAWLTVTLPDLPGLSEMPSELNMTLQISNMDQPLETQLRLVTSDFQTYGNESLYVRVGYAPAEGELPHTIQIDELTYGAAVVAPMSVTETSPGSGTYVGDGGVVVQVRRSTGPWLDAVDSMELAITVPDVDLQAVVVGLVETAAASGVYVTPRNLDLTVPTYDPPPQFPERSLFRVVINDQSWTNDEYEIVMFGDVTDSDYTKILGKVTVSRVSPGVYQSGLLLPVRNLDRLSSEAYSMLAGMNIQPIHGSGSPLHVVGGAAAVGAGIEVGDYVLTEGFHQLWGLVDGKNANTRIYRKLDSGGWTAGASWNFENLAYEKGWTDADDNDFAEAHEITDDLADMDGDDIFVYHGHSRAAVDGQDMAQRADAIFGYDTFDLFDPLDGGDPLDVATLASWMGTAAPGIVIIDGCAGFVDPLKSTFMNKGTKLYIGWNGSVPNAITSATAVLIEQLLNGATIQNALNSANQARAVTAWNQNVRAGMPPLQLKADVAGGNLNQTIYQLLGIPAPQ